eukprot:TRINITY_DN23942_c1_g1_i1.p1 TRINITY_DN23942_c1_g1~~TRINITY_DN23942_c1_g1_i1.p1  ORF type:complete len:260 (-),score=27.92 TRINITY_DN23942_c1_g1_i1:112-891(-)
MHAPDDLIDTESFNEAQVDSTEEVRVDARLGKSNDGRADVNRKANPNNGNEEDHVVTIANDRFEMLEEKQVGARGQKCLPSIAEVFTRVVPVVVFLGTTNQIPLYVSLVFRSFIYLFSMGARELPQTTRMIRCFRSRDMGRPGKRSFAPTQLSNLQESANLLLAVALIAMLRTEPMLYCLEDENKDGNGPTLIDYCKKSDGARETYYIFTLIATCTHFCSSRCSTLCGHRQVPDEECECQEACWRPVSGCERKRRERRA